jgi:hypothetical protein
MVGERHIELEKSGYHDKEYTVSILLQDMKKEAARARSVVRG